MRRIALALLALALCAPAVHAGRVAVVRWPTSTLTTGAVTVKTQPYISQATWTLTEGFLNTLNLGGYDIVPANTAGMTTFGAQSGTIGGKTYSGIVWSGFESFSSPSFRQLTACWPCSLTWLPSNGTSTTNTFYPTVPHLFIGGYTDESSFGHLGTCADNFNKEGFDPSNQAPGYGGSRTFALGNESLVWQSPQGAMPSVPQWKQAGAGVRAGFGVGDFTTCDSSYRVLIGSHGANWLRYPTAMGANGGVTTRYIPPAFRDSMYDDSTLSALPLSYASADSAKAWYGGFITYFPFRCYGVYLSEGLGQYRDVPSGVNARLVWANWTSPKTSMSGGTSSTTDNRSDLGDPAIIYCALAHMDSLTNHDLLGANPKRARQNISVSGVCRRVASMYTSGGINPADTLAFHYSVDSLAALGVPITWGVCCDSIASYPSDLKYIARYPQFSFAVERWSGSAYTLRQQKALLVAQVGADRVESTLMGSMHDFTTAELGLQASAFADSQVVDSTYIGITLSGFTNVQADAESDSSLTQADRPRNFNSTQRTIITCGTNLLVTTFPGYNPRGATMGNGRDSMYYGGTTWTNHIEGPNDSTFASHYYQRHMTGMFTNQWHRDPDRYRVFNGPGWTLGSATWGYGTLYFGEPTLTGQIARRANINTGTQVIRITASSLGSGQWGVASPNMPGFYEVKYTVNACKAVNYFAGRTLIQFVRGDQLNAADIKR